MNDGTVGSDMATDFDSRRFTELPPTPVNAEQLAAVLELESVSEVWIKRETGIFRFWIEYPDRYLGVEYKTDSSGGRPAWYRAAAPHEKGECDGLVEDIVADWISVSDSISSNSVSSPR